MQAENAPLALAPKATRPVFHPERLVAVLGRYRVAYVLTGSLAARLHGSPLLTAVAEIVPALTPANLQALANALRYLGARLYAEADPVGMDTDLTADALAVAASWDLITSCGRLRISCRPRGVAGYDALARGATRFVVHGDEILVASLADLVRLHQPPPSEEAAAEGAVLRALLARAESRP